MSTPATRNAQWLAGIVFVRNLSDVKEKLSIETIGKFYWVKDDFSFIGTRFLGDEETLHAVSRIERSIIQEHIIKITTYPSEFGEGELSFNINLLAAEHGTAFQGGYIHPARPPGSGGSNWQNHRKQSRNLLSTLLLPGGSALRVDRP